MRSLTPELLAAQKSASAAPYLKAVASDRIGGIRRLAWSRLYTGSEADGYHAACMPSDSSLIRARVTGGRVYFQRVTGPGPGSDFSSWTDIDAAASADVALCADGSRVLLFYVDAGGLAIKVRESADSGATLGAPATAVTASGAVTWLAADVKSNGDACLLYSVGATVYTVKRTGGVWGAAAAWTNSAASIAGLACYHQGDWNAAVCGTDAAGEAFAWTAVFGDGFSQASGTWSALREVSRASAGTGVPIPASYPVFGHDAFRTATGVHAAAIIKAKKKGDDWLADRVYSGVPAGMVGSRQKIEVGFMSGVSNVVHWLHEHAIEPSDRLVEEIFRAAKERNRVLTDDEILEICKFEALESERPLPLDTVDAWKKEVARS